MERKDYASQFDGTLASLSAPARTIYLLILKRKAHEDNRYCKKDQFFHSVENWTEASGYKERAVQYALKELRDLGIIEWQERPGRSTLYTHKKYITIYKPKNKRIPCTPPVHSMHPPCASNAPITTKDLTDKDLTTTWLNEKLSNTLIAKYGIDAVNDRVVVISKMNGKIQNKAGLLVASLKGNYIPDSKELREKEKSIAKAKLITDRIEKDRLEREEIVKAHEESKMTPKQIKEMFDQIGKEN